MNATELRERIRARGLDLGFDAVGFAEAKEPEGSRQRLLEWLARGHHGSMAWMAREPERRVDPERILAGARSVIVASLVYRHPNPVPLRPGLPKVSRYAQGRDYHEVVGERLHALREFLLGEVPGARTRIACDTSPVADKAFAAEAGLGWIAKNTCLIHPRLGSWTFLGEIFTDLVLPPDPPAADRCGTCTRCLDACPTDAFPQPYVLDATRCIAYWNIEHRGPLPGDWSSRIGEWLAGCDVCQDVCPWNRKAPFSELDAFAPAPALVETTLEEWEALDDAGYRQRVRGSALTRIKPGDMRRNARAVRANLRAGSGDGEASGTD